MKTLILLYIWVVVNSTPTNIVEVNAYTDWNECREYAKHWRGKSTPGRSYEAVCLPMDSFDAKGFK